MMHQILLFNCFCTDQNNSGNPAAVVTNFVGDNLEKLSLAKAIAKPVTVFISAITGNAPVLDFFYPDTQMPLCLHGTLAAGKFIFDTTEKQDITCLTVEGKRLEIVRTQEEYFQVRVSSHEFKKNIVEKDVVAMMLNLEQITHIANDLPLQIASVGSPKLLVPLTSLKLLSELRPNFELIKRWSIENGVNGLYVYTSEHHASSDFDARGFNPRTGHNEDAATGVAAAALALALGKSIQLKQGQALGRPCYIVVTYKNANDILVGGKVSDSED